MTKIIYLYFEHSASTEAIAALRQLHQRLWEDGHTVIVAPYWWIGEEGRAGSRDLRALDMAALRAADEVVFFHHGLMGKLSPIACAVIGHVVALGKPLRFPFELNNGEVLLEAHAHDIGAAVASAFTNGVHKGQQR